jgi:hypothetical protein
MMQLLQLHESSRDQSFTQASPGTLIKLQGEYQNYNFAELGESLTATKTSTTTPHLSP